MGSCEPGSAEVKSTLARASAGQHAPPGGGLGAAQGPWFSPTSKSRLDRLSSGAGFFSAVRTWLARVIPEELSRLLPASTASILSLKPASDSAKQT